MREIRMEINTNCRDFLQAMLQKFRHFFSLPGTESAKGKGCMDPENRIK